MRCDGVLAWIVLLGWMVACGSVPEDKPLEASVEFTGTQFIITNRSTDVWRDVELEVNGDFTANLGLISPGQSASVGALQLAKSDGTRFNPIQFKPQRAMVKARQPNGQRGYYVGSWK